MESPFLDNLLTNFGTLLLVLIAYKSGLLKFIMNGRLWNGSKTGDGKLDQLSQDIELIKSNHFEHLQTSMNDLKASQNEALNVLKELKEYGIKIRKE